MMSDAELPAAQPAPGQAAPGPHVHEMDPEELRVAAGDDPGLPEGVEPFNAEGEATLPDDPHTAAPGPHPHEASDHKRLRGDLKGLPEGVEPYQEAITSEGDAEVG
jgi:hypothetical protein